MPSGCSILLELALALSRVFLRLICFIIEKLPAGMFACLVLLDPGFQVGAVSIIQAPTPRFDQHIDVVHWLIQALPNFSFKH